MDISPEDLDVDVVLDRAKELVSRGLPGEAARELRLLSGVDASPDVFRDALAVMNEIVRQDPDNIDVHQRRVDFATRTGDGEVLVETCLDLADALAASGAEAKARAMYQRVLSLDPANEFAREALGEPPGEPAERASLDTVLREMPEAQAGASDGPGAGGGAATGGAAGAPGSPAGDEEAGAEWEEGLATMLSQFRARVDGQKGVEDAGDHYDLGIAFKEMGLVDEAIAEFQTALKGGEERLKVYEQLGHCFILKSQYAIAIKILKRALQSPMQDESELLGVYYFLGQCYEELGQRDEARAAYENVLAIDPDFADVPGRMARL
jgi:tetratricopeptide (TPR) repeat protein